MVEDGTRVEGAVKNVKKDNDVRSKSSYGIMITWYLKLISDSLFIKYIFQVYFRFYAY